jgi:hypothetical protein
MKGKGFIMMGMLAHAGVIPGVPVPMFGKPFELLTIETDLRLTGENSAVGKYKTSGLFTDSGNVSDEFLISKKTLKGVKTLVGTMGTITIKFMGRISWTGKNAGEADGQYEIVSCTGAYKNLYRVGESYAKIDLSTGRIIATFTSIAYNY